MAPAYKPQLKYVARFGPGGKLPDKKTDPNEWNATWNRFLEWKYDSKQSTGIKPKLDMFTPLFENYSNPSTRQSFLAQLSDNSNALLKMQVTLTGLMEDKLEGFALKWLSLGSEHRLKHILSALVDLCDTLDFEGLRPYCPESTNAFLERDSGQGLLDLITTFFVSFQSNSQPRARKDKPTLLFHPQYDAVMGFNQPCPAGRDPAVWGMIRDDFQCWRADFLCRMVIYIFGKANSLEMPQVQVYKLGMGRKENREYLSHLPDSPDSTGGYKKRLTKHMGAMQKEAAWVCTTCSLSEVNIPQGTSILFCAACLALERRVPYCNRACQTHDWKFGIPPHKTICGKAISVPSPNPVTPLRTFSQATSFPRNNSYAIPPPDKGFIRSEALEIQIMGLQLAPVGGPVVEGTDAGYVFINGLKTSLVSLSQDTWGPGYFKVFRNHAFRNGDHRAVAAM
ncbi:hypothetical protein M407DRAFT_223826 [Tulasnella calospora MUT 4182]|uniref:MYND-type domain-containing protein n=1 Tax=Tulasnella calospora MUT 4182 TaxID=1051891 RepID=A0A0C3QY77_9AGAM|nr:hypothetical protein M407DRAFT_223826 [Tulasnella calospora MUT 4182]